MTENNILIQTQTLIDEVCSHFEGTSWGKPYWKELKTLQNELSTPCVLAVAGIVKAGKSSLINSLLGVDLAMTGCTETTATINVFKAGKPISQDTPVLCQWLDGTKEWKPKSFLDSLQGTDEATLEIASKIDKLIFYVEANNKEKFLLEDITIVDTPGICANVGDTGDAHQIQTDTYFKLRNRHQEDTKSLAKSDSADAVIYLFSNVSEEEDASFLSSLHDNGKGLSALNAIGVLSKIDQNYSPVDSISKTAKAYEQELFTIIPTSAAIYKYLPSKEQAIRLQQKLRNAFPTNEDFNNSISVGEEGFLDEDGFDCLLSPIERKEILNEFAKSDFVWSAFKKIAFELFYNDDVEETLQKMADFSGIDRLRKLIDEHFFKRSHLLRCNKVLSNLMKVISQVQYSSFFIDAEYFARMKQACLEKCATLEEPYRTMLSQLVGQHVDDLEAVKAAKDNILSYRYRIEQLQSELADINDCYIAYQKMMASKDSFSDEERVELTPLLTAKVVQTDYRQRQKYWTAVANSSVPNSIRQMVANVAKIRYNNLLNEKGQ